MTAEVKQELEVIVGKFQVTLSAVQQWKFWHTIMHISRVKLVRINGFSSTTSQTHY